MKETEAFEVVEIESGRVVHRVDLRGQSPRQIEKIERGLVARVDLDRFCVREAPPR